MSPITIQSMMADPLAGSSPLFHDPAAGTNMLRGLLLRLRLFHSEKVCEGIGDQLISESKLLETNHWEYIINECLYELRRCAMDYSEQFETVLLNSWTKDLMKRLDEDAVFAFFKQVRQNRVKRKR